MTTYNWPTDGSLPLSELQLMKVDNNMIFTSVLSGDITSMSVPGARWGWGATFSTHDVQTRARIEAFVSRLSGSEHRVAMYDVARPVPQGTINLTGVTAAGAAQFAYTMSLNGCGASTTLKAGDWMGLTLADGNTQLVMVVNDATASAGGVMTAVEFRPKVRWACNAASAVVLDKPTGLFIMREPSFVSPRSGAGKANPFAIELVEVFAP